MLKDPVNFQYQKVPQIFKANMVLNKFPIPKDHSPQAFKAKNTTSNMFPTHQRACTLHKFPNPKDSHKFSKIPNKFPIPPPQVSIMLKDVSKFTTPKELASFQRRRAPSSFQR